MDAMIEFSIEKKYYWKPKEDITAYELALCLPIIFSTSWGLVEDMIADLPEAARRHFEEAERT